MATQSMNFVGVDSQSGYTYDFSLSNVTLVDNEGGERVKAVIQTKLGYAELAEDVCDGYVNRRELHIVIHDKDNIEDLFDIRDKPAMMSLDDYLPLTSISDALDQIINDLRN